MSEEPSALSTILDLKEAPETPDVFSAPSQFMPHGRIYGGQIVAQASAAALRTVPSDRSAHSLHGYFLRAGDMTQPIDYHVDRLMDGRSTSHRRVLGTQGENVVWSSILSFQVEDPASASHQVAMPDVPGPDELPAPAADRLRLGTESAFEVRRILGEASAGLGGEDQGRLALWLRLDTPAPDDLAFHQAALAYASDFALFFPVLNLHGYTLQTPGIKVTSLDHALWWHRPVRADQWILMVQESPQSGSSRGLCSARFFTQDGTLVGTVAQEVLVRVPAPM